GRDLSCPALSAPLRLRDCAAKPSRSPRAASSRRAGRVPAAAIPPRFGGALARLEHSDRGANFLMRRTVNRTPTVGTALDLIGLPPVWGAGGRSFESCCPDLS